MTIHAFGQGQNQSPVAVITNRTSTLQELRTAIGGLESSSQPPRFWTSLANDNMYTIGHRRIYLLQLFHRHVRSGMQLGQLKDVLDGHKWLKTNDIDKVTDVVGLVPVKVTFEDTIFVIRLLPQPTGDTPAVYLRVKGHIDHRHFIEMLWKEKPESPIATALLQEVGFSEP